MPSRHLPPHIRTVKNYINKAENRACLVHHINHNNLLKTQLKRFDALILTIDNMNNLADDLFKDMLEEGLGEEVEKSKLPWSDPHTLSQPFPTTPAPASLQPSPLLTPGKRSQSGSQISPKCKKLIKTRDGTVLGEIEAYVTAPELPRLPTPHPKLTPSPFIPQQQQFPLHMKNHVCHLCKRQGHFQSYCDLFTCYHCGEVAPGHYPSTCPSEAGPSSNS